MIGLKCSGILNAATGLAMSGSGSAECRSASAALYRTMGENGAIV
jgi:hypothetical protein